VPCGTGRDTTTDITVMVRCGCHVWLCESERKALGRRAPSVEMKAERDPGVPSSVLFGSLFMTLEKRMAVIVKPLQRAFNGQLSNNLCGILPPDHSPRNLRVVHQWEI